MKTLTKARIKRFMKDEAKGNKEYKEVGLDELASDEAGHYRFLKNILEQGYYGGKKLK